ncbi:MAG: hypothetical protein N3J91_09235 [Verrucomicrobiae bacterium]|nr:hypothetical protein [Verrucomicrobiae bacterium]
MLYPAITDLLTATPSGTLSSLSAQQTVTFRIKQEARRLEAVILTLKATTGASPANNHDGLAGLVKEIRLVAEDVNGKRNIVQVTGPALLSFIRNNFGSLDRHTFASYRAANLAASTAYACNFFIPVRHPNVAEPYGHQLSLPLSANFIKGDAMLEVDINPASVVFSAGAPTGATIKALAILRNVPDSVPYIPTELITQTISFAAAGKQAYDFSTTGFLTQVLVQGYNSTTYGSSIQRTNVLSSIPEGTLAYVHGRNKIMVLDNDFGFALNDLTQYLVGKVPGETTINPASFDGEVFLDFMSDYPGADAFSAASIPNLNTDALGGDKARLEFDQWANSAAMARITYHKILARTRDAIKGLAVAI